MLEGDGAVELNPNVSFLFLGSVGFKKKKAFQLIFFTNLSELLINWVRKSCLVGIGIFFIE